MSIDQHETKRKGGRPRKHPEGSRRPTLAFRVRDGMREQLDAGAKARGLSISEEIERKLAFANSLAEDPETEAVLLSLVSAIKLVRTVTGKSWKEDRNTAVMTVGAIETASAVVLAPYIGADLTDTAAKKARKAGEAMGQRALGFLFKMPDEQVMEIGQQEMQEFRMAEAGIREEDMPLIKAAMKTLAEQRAAKPTMGTKAELPDP